MSFKFVEIVFFNMVVAAESTMQPGKRFTEFFLFGCFDFVKRLFKLSRFLSLFIRKKVFSISSAS